MKHLLSVPASLVEPFFELTGKPISDWVVDSDPGDTRVGSGGGTAWMLYRAWQQSGGRQPFERWLSGECRLILHAGGQSRRLPAYAPVGKILIPLPVFRWQRGQRIDQTLLDIQIPLYHRIMQRTASQMHTLVASGDVLITTEAGIPPFPEADVICFGLWVSPEQAARHGVFFCSRSQPDHLEFMLQKPSVEEIRNLAPDYYFMMDIGIWLLSDRAVAVLLESCGWDSARQQFRAGIPDNYDLYGTFGPSMGAAPRVQNKHIRSLTVRVTALEGGAFYHFGTGEDMLESMLRIQNRVLDQRAIWTRNVKPHPSIFVQNASTGVPFHEKNRQIWIENSCIPASWTLRCRHILTGIPENNWRVELPEGVCIDIVPANGKLCLRMYGFSDKFSGKASHSGTCWMGQPLSEWLRQRNLNLAEMGMEDMDIQEVPLFPLLDLGADWEWWIAAIAKKGTDMAKFKELWLSAPRISAAQLMTLADVRLVESQRRQFRRESLQKLADNYRKSIFYQLDLDHTAREWTKAGIPPPQTLPEEESPFLRIHHRMFTARLHRYLGKSDFADEQGAFAILREAILNPFRQYPVLPRRNVYSDQIIWGRSPARIDLAGGWTDTPPYCLIEGGRVVNVAVELNGQPPLQVFIRPTEKLSVVLRSIDLGEREEIFTYEELTSGSKMGSAFAIPKAALMLAGFCPEYCRVKYGSLEEQLRDFGGGMEISLLAAIPKGSGLGTSSILAATILGTLSDFASLGWDKIETGNRTLALEQMLTAGGGWQDQFGGLLPGVKCLETASGLVQSPAARWLPDFLFRQPDSFNSMLLYYTGITRVARDILAEIVRAMFLNQQIQLGILREMKEHALHTFNAIQSNDYGLLADKIRLSWELNCRLDKGTNPPEIQHIIRRFEDYAAAWKLPGAGGGGYLLILAKDPEAAARIRAALLQNPPNSRARWINLSLSTNGFQVTRS